MRALIMLLSLVACGSHRGAVVPSHPSPPAGPPAYVFFPRDERALVASWRVGDETLTRRFAIADVASLDTRRRNGQATLLARLVDDEVLVLIERGDGDLVVEATYIAQQLGLDVPHSVGRAVAKAERGGGVLDRSVIDAVIREQLGPIRRCYERGLTDVPRLSGFVSVEFVIERDGDVREADIAGTTMNTPIVEECIADHFLEILFPEPEGGETVRVSYPFVFEAQPAPVGAPLADLISRGERWRGCSASSAIGREP